MYESYGIMIKFDIPIGCNEDTLSVVGSAQIAPVVCGQLGLLVADQEAAGSLVAEVPLAEVVVQNQPLVDSDCREAVVFRPFSLKIVMFRVAG